MRGIKRGKAIKKNLRLEAEYRRNLLRLVKSMYKGLSREVIKLFETKDLDYIKKMLQVIQGQYSDIVERESGIIINNYISKFKSDIRKDLGIGWSFAEEKRLKADIITNVELIKNIPDKAIFEISQDVFNSVANDENTEALEFKLKVLEGITDRRAKTIARDQTAKMFGTMNEISQTSNGFEYYEWVTAHDERVSTGKGGHKQLDGKIFKWKETVESREPVIDSYGETGKPTDRVNCRCIAIPVIVEDSYKMVWDTDTYKPVKQ